AACHSSAVTCYRTAYIAPRVMPYPEIDAVFNDGVDTTLLTAYVLDHEPGTVPTVTVDGTDLGIGSQNMYDDGLTGGDLVAGDHIYTWETSTTAEASSKSLPVTATDADGTGTNDVAAKVLDEDTIVLDNSDATFGSSWPVITGSGCAYLGDFQYNLAGTGLDTATWRPTIYVTGTYDVYARWVNAGNRASDAPYTINHSAGSDTVDVDQRTDGCAWQLLGTYDFNAGTAGSIVLTDDADGIVIADGIMLELVP
ncbi:MAG: hypothetical protein SWE60_11665, partial [Thermodesulfobacteriota bacterium]|nr:hypothetical protein [Thermodesulfobacteriota bacterium]